MENIVKNVECGQCDYHQKSDLGVKDELVFCKIHSQHMYKDEFCYEGKNKTPDKRKELWNEKQGEIAANKSVKLD